jgi:Xaa-Pro aminopeptidase
MTSTPTTHQPTDSDDFHSVTPGRARRTAFSEAEFRARIAAVQREMHIAGFDVLLVHAPENIYYLTGYETSGYFEYQVLVVPARGDPELLVRIVERMNVDEYSWMDRARVWRDGTDYFSVTAEMVKAVKSRGAVGLERHSWFVTADVASELERRLPLHELVGSNRLVERLRLVKSDAEIHYVRRAAGLADIAMSAALEASVAGATERDIAAAAHAAQIIAGAEYPALPHYVSSGARLEVGHAHWTETEVHDGSLLKLEFLGVTRRYHAGLTRPAVIGHASDVLREEVALCVALQDQTLADVRPGASVDKLTREARARLADTGRPAFKIRLGYSMGIGFPPIAGEGQTADFREDATWTLQAGMVFHMLSVMRVGLVVSDTILINEFGHERLTRTPRELLIAHRR